jgi:hypothetical protein
MIEVQAHEVTGEPRKKASVLSASHLLQQDFENIIFHIPSSEIRQCSLLRDPRTGDSTPPPFVSS